MKDKRVHSIINNIDPDHIVDVLGITWDYERLDNYDLLPCQDPVNREVLVFKLGEREGANIELEINKDTKLVILYNYLREESGFETSNAVYLREVKNIICNEEFKKIIIESVVGMFYSTIEITRRKGEWRDWLDITTNLNLEKEDYEQNYKNWW